MTTSPFAAADAIQDAMFRVWASPQDRVAGCTRLGRRWAEFQTGPVYPMQLAPFLAKRGWDVADFIRAIS